MQSDVLDWVKQAAFAESPDSRKDIVEKHVKAFSPPLEMPPGRLTPPFFTREDRPGASNQSFLDWNVLPVLPPPEAQLPVEETESHLENARVVDGLSEQNIFGPI